ncbi:helix-turn-helix domain-containing protein [Candidatus Shapirobacteria bacterium]|nr:helix-turn-helix domain-containing protein [Candidatus Shapirobacteria bacterium]
MAYPIELKNQAISLRKKGFSLKEIAEKFGIAKSTASVWLQNINLNQKAQKRLEKRKILGQYKTILIKRAQREKLLKEHLFKAKQEILKINFNNSIYKLFCALLYWCEGGKTEKTHLRFINSDPTMIYTFLKLLRNSFNLDERKFRAILHLHDYHDEKKQKKFWSNLTKIPLNQFNKSYHKPNTKKRIRKNYPGCLAIYYYDHKIAKELAALYNSFAKYLGA